jgi:hypothetical protein
MTITALPTPPSRSNPTGFAAAGDTFMAALPTFATQANALAANLNSIAAGGAYAIPYTFSTTTTDADPSAGFLRLDNTTQNLATTIRMEVVDAMGSNWQSVIDTFDASTSTVKGAIRIFKQGDATKWLTFNVTARTALTGYRDIAVTCTGSSSANPFANGDAVMVHFQRAGDKGDTGTAVSGLVLLGSTVASSAVSSINYLNIFSSAYDKYIIDFQKLASSTGTNDVLAIQLAKAGAVDGATIYSFIGANGLTTEGSLTTALQVNSATILTGKLEVLDVNGNYYKPMDLKGIAFSGTSSSVLQSVDYMGLYQATNVVTGFRVFFVNGQITGTVRVYGVKNS